MKIAILADPIDNQKGGIHVYTRDFVNALIRNPGKLEILLVREKYDPELEGFVEQLIIPNIRWGLGLAALRLLFVVPFLLWRKGVDAVLEPAHFGPFNLPRRIRRITVMHDLTPILFPHYHHFHSHWLQKNFLSGILRRADLILSNSRHTQTDIEQHYPFTKGKVKTIYLGLSTPLGAVATREYLDQTGIHQPYWLAVGTIEPRKNLVRLLEAYTRFRDQHQERVQLVIAGQRGWKSEPFFEALEKHPWRSDILLTGFVPDEALPQLYSHAIGLVYPSEYEGFGFPVLEAMACACPVICSGSSSLPEVGGEVAFYADPHQPTQIAQQMHKLFTLKPQEREVLQAKALQRAAQFTWAAYVEEFKRIILG